jgi:hypothetical protein
MVNGGSLWEKWALSLHRWGLDRMAAFLLEAGGPITVLAAQVVYLMQPFFRSSFTENQLGAIINLFEDQQAGRNFAAYLREEENL